MFEQLATIPGMLGLDWSSLLWGVPLFLVMFALSLAEVTLILVYLPRTYFLARHQRKFLDGQNPWLRVLAIIGKNLLGLLHIGLGVVLSLPGVPGQGALTILLGVMMLDIPGIRRVERYLVSRPRILKTINRLRARFGKPPLLLDGESPQVSVQTPSSNDPQARVSEQDKPVQV